jgi:CMP-N,N'-diacetyllegionaminic acid synthase
MKKILKEWDFIAIIPARGNSKSIPHKNIKEIFGKPLIYWTIKAAKESKNIQKVFVSTDNQEIKKIAERYGAEVVSQEGVEDDKTSPRKYDLSKESYLDSSIANIEKKGYFSKNFIFLQCTSPLTISEDIDKAYLKYKKENYDSLLTVTKSCGGFKCGGFLWDKEGNSINYDYKNRKKRQDIPENYLENGAFYIFSKKNFQKNKNRLGGKIGYYEMPSSRSFEIDEKEDWDILEKIGRDILVK